MVARTVARSRSSIGSLPASPSSSAGMAVSVVWSWRDLLGGCRRRLGQVENQVGTIRERLFSPRVRVRSMEELNDWLVDQCVARAEDPTPIRRSPTGRSGRCSKTRGRASCPIAAASTGSTPCRPRCPRPASCGSTTTNTRSRPAPSVARWRSAPIPTGSSCARTGASSASMPAPSGVDGRQAPSAGAHPPGQGRPGGRGDEEAGGPRPGRARPVLGHAEERPAEAGRGRRPAGRARAATSPTPTAASSPPGTASSPAATARSPSTTRRR